MTTSFQLVSDMNKAFGNPKGDYANIDLDDVRSQCLNIFDEYLELMKALGLPIGSISHMREAHQDAVADMAFFDDAVDLLDIRDALCDIQVFAMGAQHKMGVNGDDDMRSVVDGVMTRFIKNENDLEATLDKHDVVLGEDVALEGEYPTAVLRSIKAGPDRPVSKFLKSASFSEPVFTDPELSSLLDRVHHMDEHTRWDILNDGELFDHGVSVVVDDKPVRESFVVKYKRGGHSAFEVAAAI